MEIQKKPVSAYLRFIFGLPDGYIFTTRDVLPFAPRSTIDTALSRMVRNGLLERLARGVFRFFNPANPKVSSKQIVAIKRKAFGRAMATAATSLEKEEIRRLQDRGRELVKPSSETYLAEGRTSSFLIHRGGRRVNTKGVAERMIKLGESRAGRAMRDLWLTGNKDLTYGQLFEVWQSLSKREIAKIPALKKYMPQWLTELIPETPESALEKLMIRKTRKPIIIDPLKNPKTSRGITPQSEEDKRMEQKRKKYDEWKKDIDDDDLEFH